VSEEDVRLWLTRLETKLDVVLDQHGTTLNDHETRIRNLEKRPIGLTGNRLVAGAVAVLGLAISIMTVLDRLYA